MNPARWPSPMALIDRLGDLPPMPHVARKALNLIRDAKSDLADLAEVLVLDQALAALVLRWANSGYYMLRAPVTTVSQAVVYLGLDTVQNLVLTGSLAALLERPLPGYGLGRGELWRRSIAVAAAARLAAAQFGAPFAEEAYHAGLLADVGKLALEVLLRDTDLTAPAWRDRSFSEVELELFGVDHPQLGAEIARRWHLPDVLVEAIAYHHQPHLAGEGYLLAAAVHVGDAAVLMLGIGLGHDGLRYALDPVACERLGWDASRLPDLVDRLIPLLQATDLFLEGGGLKR